MTRRFLFTLIMAAAAPAVGGACAERHDRHRQRHLGRRPPRRHRRSIQRSPHREVESSDHRRGRAYLIPDLRPGTYVVTFSLTGFSTIRRTELSLPSEFTMTLNADLRVGALEESITVTGDAPVVDVTTAVHTQVLNREAMDAIPTGRTIQGLGQLVVGINLSLPDSGGARAMQQTYMSTHGMTSANNTVMVDGMMVNGLQADGAVQSYFNDAMNQESQLPDVRHRRRNAGRRRPPEHDSARRRQPLQRRLQGGVPARRLAGREHDAPLIAAQSHRGHVDRTDHRLHRSQGGPIKKDKLWFFGPAATSPSTTSSARTMFDDGGQGDRLSSRSGSALGQDDVANHIKNKMSAYFDEVNKNRGHDMQRRR